MSSTITGESLQDELESQLPSKGCWIEHRSFSKSDIPPVLYGEERDHNTPNKWAEYRAKKLEENYCGTEKTDLGIEIKTKGNTIYIYRSTEQRIYQLILKGEIKGSNGLVISENQFYNKKPKYSQKYGNYHPELQLKISGDYNPKLQHYHNKPAKVLEIIDEYHYVVKTESKNRLRIRDTDVKSWINTNK